MTDNMNIQWYPGHMTKTRRQIEADLKQVDAVCEIVDARIPLSSRNPDIDAICGSKPRMIVLNRMDLADPAATSRWKSYFEKKGMAVIATQGQIVDMDFENGIVYVDGLPLEEDYVNTPTNLDEGNVFPQIVEEGCVFVMGDNRNNSKDSRSPEIGQVDTREVLGKVALLLFPGTDGGNQERNMQRIGTVQ